jgi:hypothetical protein
MSGSTPVVYALTAWNGELIAGGSFTTAGGVTCNYIARWDGTSWEPLSSGMNTGVDALTVYNEELIAGGDFTTAGSVACNKIARWGCPYVVGDLNCDGAVNFGDINPFVLYLSNFSGWQATYLDCRPEVGDINGDGIYPSFGDINPFVALLSGS